MHIDAHQRQVRRPRTAERGTALIEFVFALPFLFFILILSLNFCKVFLMKQRTLMAVRYVAFADVHRKTPPNDMDVSNLFFGGEGAHLMPATDSSASQISIPGQPYGNGADTLGGVVRRIDTSNQGIAGFMNGLSGTSAYQVQHQYRPAFARGDYWGKGQDSWFPTLNITANLTMDSKDWRNGQMNYKDMMKSIVGSLSRIF